MRKKADEEKKQLDDEQAERIKDIMDTKKQGKVFKELVRNNAAPCIYVFLGAFFACIVGLVSPTVGYLIVSNIFTINKV